MENPNTDSSFPSAPANTVKPEARLNHPDGIDNPYRGLIDSLIYWEDGQTDGTSWRLHTLVLSFLFLIGLLAYLIAQA